MDMSKDAIQALAGIAQDAAPRTVDVATADGRLVATLGVTKDSNGAVHLTSIKRLLDEYAELPERRKGTAKLLTLASFIAHVLRNKDADSVLFGNPDNKTPSLTAVFDYNLAGPARIPPAPDTAAEVVEAKNPNRARHGEHRAVYAFPLSEQWQKWTAKDGEAMSQAQFAAFLEDRVGDLAEPAAADTMGATVREFMQKVAIGVAFAGPSRLLALSRDFAIHNEEKVRTAINLQTGETSIQYEAEHTDQQGAPVKVPGAFVICVPVFKAGAAYQIPARLRYRLAAGRISWLFNLYEPSRMYDDAFADAFKTTEAATGLPLFVGSPES